MTLCTVCRHPHRARIEQYTMRGYSLRAVAAKFELGYHSVRRHKLNHMPAQLKAALVTRQPEGELDLEQLRKSEGEGLLQEIVVGTSRCVAALNEAEEISDLRAVAGLHGKWRDWLTLKAKVLGELGHGSVHVENLVMNPTYLDIRVDLLEALRPFPEARQAVAKVFHGREAQVIEHAA